MFNQSVIRASRPALRTATRSFSASAKPMAGVIDGSDAFRKREKGDEDFAIRQREKEKLKDLQEKLKEQKEAVEKLSSVIDEIAKGKGKQ